MSLYIPKMSDTPAITIPGLADNFGLLDGSQIVEQGSNENGEYVRWENGLQVCWRESGYLWASTTGWETIAWPASFINSRYIVVAVVFNTSVAYCSIRGRTTGTVDVNVNTTGMNVYVAMLAIGRWK